MTARPPIGEGDDAVRLVLGGRTTITVKTYEIQLSVLQQPAAFGVQLGSSLELRRIMAENPPNTPFQLFIGNALQFTGRTDGYTAQIGQSGSTLQLRGRDALAPLHDAFVTSEQSFADITYGELTRKVLDKTIGAGNYTLALDNTANRKTRSGTQANTTPSNQAQVEEVVGGSEVLAGPKTQQQTLRTQLGQQWYAGFLKPELDRAGLFLWAAADGTLVLSQLYPRQEPLYRIVRRRGIGLDNSALGTSRILEATYRNEPTARYSRCDVHGRRAGGAASRANIIGSFVDQEMVAWGYDRPLSVDDDRAKTIAQAEFLARRKIAEARRGGWSLTYTFAGHTTPCLQGGRAVWSPETVVQVEDDEFDLAGAFYVEAVRHAAQPHATTTITLMRPEDVLFGEEAE